MYDVTRGLQKNGTFLLNTIFDDAELEKFMPNKVKRYFAQNNITVYTINATKIAQEIGLGNRTNTILQSAFFRITEVIPVELAVEKMKAAALKSYGAKGQDVVDKNYAAIDRGGEYKKFEVKAEWANLADDAEKQDDAPAFVKELVRPIDAQAGDLLKVSDFVELLLGEVEAQLLRQETYRNVDGVVGHFIHADLVVDRVAGADPGEATAADASHFFVVPLVIAVFVDCFVVADTEIFPEVRTEFVVFRLNIALTDAVGHEEIEDLVAGSGLHTVVEVGGTVFEYGHIK